MKIKVTRAFYLGGEVQPLGTEIDTDDKLARELIHNGKAVAVVATPTMATSGDDGDDKPRAAASRARSKSV